MSNYAPMSDERLAEIRDLADNINQRGRYSSGAISPSEVIYAQDVGQLLAYVERLRAVLRENHKHIIDVASMFSASIDTCGELREEVAAMRPIVEAVALGSLYTTYYPAAGPVLMRCQWCWQVARNTTEVRHLPECVREQARALLNLSDSSETPETGGAQ